MAHVKVDARPNEPVERLIKRFSRKVKREGILEEYKERRYYEKPSVARKLKKIRRKKVARRLAEEERNK